VNISQLKLRSEKFDNNNTKLNNKNVEDDVTITQEVLNT
jgi:hypothetical protein